MKGIIFILGQTKLFQANEIKIFLLFRFYLDINLTHYLTSIRMPTLRYKVLPVLGALRVIVTKTVGGFLFVKGLSNNR
ncbi:hypothetical protein, partial [Crenothrix sp.]|uniref:hypothetical protein n=1 Tax=Crenothrix sp. TaxID=3100433 RepID=UPI00374D3219